MKILIAGATGAIGQPLMSFLVDAGYEVYGITQSYEKTSIITQKGAQATFLNILDASAVASALKKIQPHIVIDMLTHLPKEYTPESMKRASEMDAKVRVEGGRNLQQAAENEGVLRYIIQSSAFWYEPGNGLADETSSFSFQASPGISAGCRIYAELENRVLETTKIEGVALRFGFFYGPGTWFRPKGNMDDQLQKQEFPLIGEGQGVWNFVHIHDAAHAVVSALACKPGIYNIVNDQPSKLCDWLPAFAHYLNAPAAPIISEEEGLKQKGPDFVYYATKLRGASNEKAKQAFHFNPRPLEWFE